MANRFYTVLVIPEKTSQVRRFILPSWVVKGSLIGMFFAVAIATIMLLDYWFVMSQITENKSLKMENRRLRQQVQVFRNKMTTVEGTMERVKTFSTRLKVITNIEDREGLLQSLNQKLPDAVNNLGATVVNTPTPTARTSTDFTPAELAARASTGTAQNPLEESFEDAQLRRDAEELSSHLSHVNEESLFVEQTLQDQYELLADQKAFLAALPTRKPAIGYFTSGFGVRKSPYGGREKMHEGLDIANRPGTPIKAPADGLVSFASSKAGYGQTVVLDHGYGLETLYGHTRKLLVSKGQKVKRGDTIALLGNSGRSTGPHVHYEVHVRGIPVDPLSYILEN